MTDFATYLDRTERDQLAAENARLQAEYGEALATITDVWQALNAAGMASPVDGPAELIGQLAAQRDTAIAERDSVTRQLTATVNCLDQIRRDLQRELDGLKADNTSLRRANRELIAENCRRRGELAAAQELIAEIRNNRERDDRALAAYDTATDYQPAAVVDNLTAPLAGNVEIRAFHVTRGTGPSDLEARCPCPKAPCGGVDTARTDPACDQHPPARARTMRQMHRADQCPAQAEG